MIADTAKWGWVELDKDKGKLNAYKCVCKTSFPVQKLYFGEILY